MNRLTARDEHGNAYYPEYFGEPCNGGGCTKDMCDFAAEACDKLAAYEDTGLDPEQLSVIDEEYLKMAKELAELRKYKRLGTLEELEMLKATHFTGTELIKIAINLKQLDEYKHIGTLEEVREAVEKQRAKRAKIKMLCRDIEYWCPNCRERHIVMHSKKGLDYCHHCGQKLDWSNKDDR